MWFLSWGRVKRARGKACLGRPGVNLKHHPLCFLRQGLTWSLPSLLGWLLSEPQRSTSLHLSTAWGTGVRHDAWLFAVFSRNGTQVLIANALQWSRLPSPRVWDLNESTSSPALKALSLETTGPTSIHLAWPSSQYLEVCAKTSFSGLPCLC